MTGNLELDLAILCVTLVFSGLFSSSETALTALSETKARQIIEENRRGSRYLQMWLDRPNRVLTTILIGNNVVNTFAAAATTLVAQQIFGSSALSIAVGVTTIAILVAGEITPKTFAKHNAERVAPLSMFLVMPLYYALFPVVIAFTWLSKTLVRLTGGDVTRTGPFITEEDVAYMIKLGQSEGVFEAQESAMLENVFEFGDTLVKEIMVPRTALHAIPADATLDEIFDGMREHGHTRMPVFRENIDDVVGLFHTKELMHIVRTEDEINFKLKDYIREPFFVPELMKIGDVLKEFQRRKTHLAIVVDEYGGTAGIVSLEDILEEIVGEIRDEYDQDEHDEFRRIDDDHFVANGRASVNELGEALDVAFPDDGAYETLGGFLISQWGRMPPPAARIAFDGWLFIVKDADNRKVIRVEVERIGSHISDRNPSSPRVSVPDLSTPLGDDIGGDDDGGDVLSIETFREKA